MRRSFLLFIMIMAGLLFSAMAVEAQDKIRAEGTAAILNNRVDIARD